MKNILNLRGKVLGKKKVDRLAMSIEQFMEDNKNYKFSVKRK